MDNDTVKVEIIKGVEGLSVCIDDTRICGSKPWGGGTVIAKWDKVPKEYLEEVLVNVIDLQAENKKLKEQQLTEDEMKSAISKAEYSKQDFDVMGCVQNRTICIEDAIDLLAKAIIKAREEINPNE